MMLEQAFDEYEQFVITWMPNLGYDFAITASGPYSAVVHRAKPMLLPPGEGWNSYHGRSFSRIVSLDPETVSVCMYTILPERDEFGRLGILYGHGFTTRRTLLVPLLHKQHFFHRYLKSTYFHETSDLITVLTRTFRAIQEAFESKKSESSSYLESILRHMASQSPALLPEREGQIRERILLSRLFDKNSAETQLTRKAAAFLRKDKRVLLNANSSWVYLEQWFCRFLTHLLQTRRPFVATSLALDLHEQLQLACVPADARPLQGIRRGDICLTANRFDLEKWEPSSDSHSS